MIRAQRRTHAFAWLLVAPLALLALAVAIWLRPPEPVQAAAPPPQGQDEARPAP